MEEGELKQSCRIIYGRKTELVVINNDHKTEAPVIEHARELVQLMNNEDSEKKRYRATTN